MKLDKTSMEKPKMIVIEVFKIATPTVSWHFCTVWLQSLIFGIFKGYVICVCIFALLNWFYPHEKWPIGTKDSYTFPLVFSGSKFLIKEFPNSEDYLDDTKNKIKNI